MMKLNLNLKHKAVFLNTFSVLLLFLVFLYFLNNLKISLGISLIVITIAITGTIIAEIREETLFIKEMLKAN